MPKFIADFHLHSKYSRATSSDMDIENLSRWAKTKGITLLGTGDFTHPNWVRELKEKLKPVGNGLYQFSKGEEETYFILTAEVNNIFTKEGKTRRIHNIIFAPSFEVVDKINYQLGKFGILTADGRPVLSFFASRLVEMVLDISPECLIVPAHIWTPHFSLFGANAGFDRIEECFEEQTKNIFALETGLSSDPAMNWRLSALDRYSLISNSDAHSPSRIGREANVFNCQLSYPEIVDVLKKKDKNRFLYTIEFFPQEGKYHFDGHRNCQTRISPTEARLNNNLCPACGKKITVGVMHRLENLADREEGIVSSNAIPFKNLIPLEEIIADVLDLGVKTTTVENEYQKLIKNFDNEFNVLLELPQKALASVTSKEIAEGIINVREGKVEILPGYDGEYGKIKIAREEKAKEISKEETKGQLKLF
ncbi:MAG: endonuclease Q family protein [Candidatus Edwardsbacteria bacterium]